MRDIGDKVAPHGLGLLDGGDVAGEQQQTPPAIGVQMHRQPDRPRWRAFAPRHDQHMAEIAVGKVAGKTGVTHQVAQVLQQVAFRVKTKMRGGSLIEPLNLPVRIE